MIHYAGGHRRYLEADRGQPAPAEAQLLDALVAAAPGHNLSAAAPVLAAELVALGALPADQARAMLVLVCLLLIDAERGSTRSPLDPEAVRRKASALLRGWPEGDALAHALAGLLPVLAADGPLVGPPGARRPLIRTGEWLAIERTHRAEAALAERLRARLARPDHAVDVTPPSGGIPLSEEQTEAVVCAATRPLTLISGGPGTGKTSIVVAVLRTLVRAGVDPARMVLAAPTGKAAWRMGEAVRAGLHGLEDAPDRALLAGLPAPSTLHRALGYSERDQRFRRHARDPLDADLVVVDESSMIDVYLMERLVGAVRPEARLVLLGDVDQLPSVAAGAVFRDVTWSAPAACATLTRSYRMRADDPAGSAILRVAGRVRVGDADLFGADAVRVASIDTLTGAGVELLPPDPLAHRAYLDAWFARCVQGADPKARTRAYRLDEVAALDALFAQDGAARILCITREGDGGAAQANEELHARTARATRQNLAVPFLVGEPVMVQRNDYERGLFNGDHGLVLRVVEPDGVRPMVVFPGDEGYRAFHVEALAARLRLGYAMTVHKAQGSEYEQVAIMLPNEEVPLLTRELLYTAITRAKRSVQFIGSPLIVGWGVERRVARHSGLADALGAPPGGPARAG